MKFLDPFAGYRLASGHAFFHIALFLGSFLVQLFGEDGFNSSNPEISDAFMMLRWAHFVLFVLSII